MKKIYSFLALAAMSFGVNAQVNLDFEATITPVFPGIISTTAGWGQGSYVATTGNNSAQGVLLKTQEVEEDGELFILPGAIRQEINLSDLEDYIQNVTLQMDFKYIPQGGDTMVVVWQGYHVDGENETVVYNGSRIFPSTATTWSSFQTPFNLTRVPGTTLPANQLFIAIFNSRVAATVNTELYLDNVVINGLPTSAIDKVTQNGINVYPNPAKDVVNISVEQGDLATVDVLTLDGKLVISSTDSKVDVSELTSGMYIFKVRSTSGAVSTQKVTVK